MSENPNGNNGPAGLLDFRSVPVIGVVTSVDGGAGPVDGALIFDGAVTQVGNTFTFGGAGGLVTSVEADIGPATGAIILVAGAGITIAQSGTGDRTFTFTATGGAGVTSINALTGDFTFAAGPGLSVSVSPGPSNIVTYSITFDAVKAFRTSNQTIADATPTDIIWESVLFGDLNSGALPQTEYTAVSNGTFLVIVRVWMSVTSTPVETTITVAVNGVPMLFFDRTLASVSITGQDVIEVSGIVELALGDKVKAQFRNDSDVPGTACDLLGGANGQGTAMMVSQLSTSRP